MSSRFYFETTVVQTTGVTTIDSTWDTDCRATQGIPGRTFKLTPAGTSPVGISYTHPSGIPGAASPLPRHTMHAMFEYTMPVGLLITGNVRGEFAGYRTNNGDNISNNVAIHIRNGTTHKATVATVFSASNFYGFNPGHVQAMLATPIVDDGYITVAGDILYAEVGLGWTATPQAVASVTVGYNDGNIDWPNGEDGTPDANPPTHNPWFEFMTTLGAAPAIDDPLPTFSATTVAARPSSPSLPGLHFYDRATHIESIWDGSTWTNMVSGISGVTSGTLGFSSTFGVSVTLTGNTFTWDAQALSVSGSRTKTLLLTDDVTEGAFLSAATTFGVNALALKAPNATDALRIGKFGNLAMAGSALNDSFLFNMQKTNYGVTSTTPTAINFTLTNTDIGSGGMIAQGFVAIVTGSLATAGATSSSTVQGAAVTVIGGAASNNRFMGTLRGYQTTCTLSSSVTGTSVTLIEHYRAAGGLITRSALTDYVGFRMITPTTLLGSLANIYGFKGDALTIGSTRVGALQDGMTTGSAALAYGFWSKLHAVGTTRRSFIGDNSFECSQQSVIIGTSGKGLIVADTVDGNYYILTTASGIIGASSIGTGIPSV